MFEDKIRELNLRNEGKVEEYTFEKRTYTVQEIQNILGISRASAYNLVKKEYFKTVRIGCTIRISKKTLMNGWIVSYEIYIGGFGYGTT